MIGLINGIMIKKYLSIYIILICLISVESIGQNFSRIFSGDIVNNGGISLGAIWGDYNNDGFVDLFVPNANNENNFLYKNNGDGTFTRVTTGAIVSDQGHSISASWGDFDNDRDLDLFVTNSGQDNFLYINNGNGTFTKDTESVVLSAGDQGCAWGDYDNDGWLDLVVTSDNMVSNVLYHNNGDGTFTKIMNEIGSGASVGVNWVDFDNDNDLDLFIVNYNEANFLFVNEGDGTFSNFNNGNLEIVTDVESSWSASWGDYDNNGFLDLIVANKSGANSLYKNVGGVFVKEVAGDLGIDAADSEGTAWGDYDNDGWLDLYVSNSNTNANLLYKNNGGTFTSIIGSYPTSDIGTTTGTAWADYDNDGDLDLFVANASGDNYLYQNNNSGNYLDIELRGIKQYPFGTGAKVRLNYTDASSSTFYNITQSTTQSGNRGQSPNRLHFGVGSATNIATLNVFWPNGTMTLLQNVGINQKLTIKGQGPNLYFYNGYAVSQYAFAKAGSRLNLTAYVGNNGDFSSNFSSLKYYISTDQVFDNDDVYLGAQDLPSFSANNIRSLTAAPTVPSSMEPGTYYILFVLDNDNLVTETDETDNIQTELLEIVDFDLPDFEVTQFYFEMKKLNPGQSFVISDGILNNGTGDGTAVNIQYILSTDVIVDGGDIVLDSFEKDLPAGTSTFVERTLTIPPSTPKGTYYLIEIVDRNDDILELDETNNVDDYQDDQIIEVTLKPSPPTNLIAEVISDNQVNLTWTDNSNNAAYGEQQFTVVRDGADIATIGMNSESFSDFSVAVGGFYKYEVYGIRYDNVTVNDVNGNITSVVSNPVSGGINTSSQVARVDRSIDPLSGFYFEVPFKLNVDTPFKLKVYSPFGGATVKFKIENSDNPSEFVERDQTITSASIWEDLVFDFTSESADTYDIITLYLDYGSVASNTFYFDDITLPSQTIDFETGQLQVRVESDRSNSASAFILDPNCTFDIPTNVTWTAVPETPYCGNDPGAVNNAVVIEDLGDGRYSISDLLARSYLLCGYDVDEPAIFSSPCDGQFVEANGGSGWGFRANGLITYDEGTSTLRIPFTDYGNNIDHVTILTANATGIFPTKPGNLVAEGISGSQVSLEWASSSNADTYTIQRSTSSGSGFTFLVTISASTSKYVDANNLVEGTRYYYRVRASNAQGDSPFSDESSTIPIVAKFQKIVSGELVESTSGQGSAWGDYDNDGDLDLFTPSFSGFPNFFFENNGDGTFTRLLGSNIVEDTVTSRSASWADVNNDGELDLFVASADTLGFLFVNNGDKTFTKTTVGDEGDNQFQTSAWADYDNDGFVDLFVGRINGFSGQPNYLFRNNGDNTFSKVTSDKFPDDNNATSWGAAWADYDLDGDPDLFVANRYGQQDLLYQNNGDGSFTLVDNILTSGFADSRSPSWGDYDNDGDPDLYVGTANTLPNLLYQNNGDGTFTKITSGIIVDNELAVYGSSWGDYNNDGWLDLFVAVYGFNQVYTNNGDGTFSLLVGEPLVENSDFTIGGSFGDYNNDGYLDLIVPNTQGLSNDLYLNNGDFGNGYINIKLVGTASNTSAIGAKVELTANGMTQYQEVSGQTGYGSQNSLNLEFGLGGASSIDNLIVYWPSGSVQTLNNVAKDQFITIYEDTSGPEITLVDVPNTFSNAAAVLFKADITDVSGVESVKGFYRGLTASPDDSWIMMDNAVATDDRYEITLKEDYFDELGINAYFLAEDILGNTSSSDTVFIYLDFEDTDATLSGLVAGSEVKDYQMISVPLDLDQSGVAAVFSELGAYDKAQWRVFHYQGDKNVEFQSGLSSIDRGKGYWFIAKSTPASLQAGSGDNALTDDEPFSIQLSQGWNQIGNPYAFNVLWQDVLDFNGITTAQVSELFTFSNGSYTSSDRLMKYKGAFVEAPAAINILIPYQKNSGAQGGRTSKNGKQDRSEFNSRNWELPFELISGDITYDLSAIGMNEAAKIDRDQFDRLALPRFIEYLDVVIEHDDYYYKDFTKDIIPSAPNHVWNFKAGSNMRSKDLELKWDMDYLNQSDNNFKLLDVSTNKIIDMKAESSYVFSNQENRNFKLFYGDDDFINKEMNPSEIGMGKAYPNPFDDLVTIPYYLSVQSEEYNIEVAVYNSNGKRVFQIISEQNVEPGYHFLEWNGRGNNGQKLVQGIYLIKMTTNGTERKEFYSRIILK